MRCIEIKRYIEIEIIRYRYNEMYRDNEIYRNKQR